ncbi:MAG TPA: TetR/AcrR family transcriptional regulator [Gemmatimonadales bacterium]|jgi:AcrR family transcriptional regulator
MSPRPRKVNDDEVFGAVYRAMNRLSPAELTLAEIGAEAGITAGALVQRFGSKRNLLLALWAQVADGTDAMFAQLEAASPTPLAAVYAYGECFAQMVESPGGLAHHLAWLQLDLTDPDFHRYAEVQARATGRALRRLLEAAIEAGEVRRTADTRALARMVQVTVTGSLFAWAFMREGPVTRWVRTDLEMAVRPYLTRAALPGSRRRRGSRRS